MTVLSFFFNSSSSSFCRLNSLSRALSLFSIKRLQSNPQAQNLPDHPCYHSGGAGHHHAVWRHCVQDRTAEWGSVGCLPRHLVPHASHWPHSSTHSHLLQASSSASPPPGDKREAALGERHSEREDPAAGGEDLPQGQGEEAITPHHHAHLFIYLFDTPPPLF